MPVPLMPTSSRPLAHYTGEYSLGAAIGTGMRTNSNATHNLFAPITHMRFEKTQQRLLVAMSFPSAHGLAMRFPTLALGSEASRTHESEGTSDASESHRPEWRWPSHPTPVAHACAFHMEELHRPLAAAFTNGQFIEWLLTGALGDVLSADGRRHQVATLEPERPLTTQASSKFMFHKS